MRQTDRQTSYVRQNHRLMPRLLGAGHNKDDDDDVDVISRNIPKLFIDPGPKLIPVLSVAVSHLLYSNRTQYIY